ncbi:hypothetical protein [Fluviibacter phosphoraccumulans]|uniref:hypothetical protein n=1 Tax=Fluviibacter phosphoraccumulans TaxID=1751046 RepID=UPI001B3C6A11|nr:hypothetical protein [Fluviibacter phosphoraccumulans]
MSAGTGRSAPTPQSIQTVTHQGSAPTSDIQAPADPIARVRAQSNAPTTNVNESVAPPQSSIDVGAALQSSIQSSKQNALRSAESWDKSHSFGADEARGWVKAEAEAQSKAQSTAKSLSDSAGLSKQDEARLSAVFGLGLTNVPGVKAGIEASAMTNAAKTSALQYIDSHGEDFKSMTEASRRSDHAWKSFDQMKKSHGIQDDQSTAHSYQTLASLSRSIGMNEKIQEDQFGKFMRNAGEDRLAAFNKIMNANNGLFARGGALDGYRTHEGMAHGSDYGKIEAMINSGNSNYVATAGLAIAALTGTTINTGFNANSNLADVAPGQARAAYQAGPGNSTSPPTGFGPPIHNPTDEVQRNLGDNSKTLRDGESKVKNTSLLQHAGDALGKKNKAVVDEMSGNLRDMTDSILPRNNNPQSRGGGGHS